MVANPEDVALNSMRALAYLFSYLYGIVGNNVLLVGSGGGTVADSLRHMGPTDTLFAIGFKPYSRETVMAAQFARQCGSHCPPRKMFGIGSPQLGLTYRP